jgi:hypothetical protein
VWSSLRQQIEDYHPDVRAQVRRAYLLKGPTEPIVKFPSKKYVTRSHTFSENWYKTYDCRLVKFTFIILRLLYSVGYFLTLI